MREFRSSGLSRDTSVNPNLLPYARRVARDSVNLWPSRAGFGSLRAGRPVLRNLSVRPSACLPALAIPRPSRRSPPRGVCPRSSRTRRCGLGISSPGPLQGAERRLGRRPARPFTTRYRSPLVLHAMRAMRAMHVDGIPGCARLGRRALWYSCLANRMKA